MLHCAAGIRSNSGVGFEISRLSEERRESCSATLNSQRVSSTESGEECSPPVSSPSAAYKERSLSDDGCTEFRRIFALLSSAAGAALMQK
jgi:hypothetical protein